MIIWNFLFSSDWIFENSCGWVFVPWRSLLVKRMWLAAIWNILRHDWMTMLPVLWVLIFCQTTCSKMCLSKSKVTNCIFCQAVTLQLARVSVRVQKQLAFSPCTNPNWGLSVNLHFLLKAECVSDAVWFSISATRLAYYISFILFVE